MRQVLLVDDNPKIHPVITEALDHHQVISAFDGDECVSILENKIIDLVILDIEMPTTNGWETLRIIKDEENGWPEIPVIIMTCVDDWESFLKSAMLGADYCIDISKPSFD